MSAEEAEEVVVALSTAPDPETAERIAGALLEARLIACATLLPGAVSLYRWEGAMRRDSEVVMVMKTRRARVPELLARLPELHPYEVPELLVTGVEGGLAPYCAWVAGET